jgi:hypothetical protein
MCFQGAKWLGLKPVLEKCPRMLQNWSVLQRPEDAVKLGAWAVVLDKASSRPPRLTWEPLDAKELELYNLWLMSL